MKTTTAQNALSQLIAFANQRPGLDFADYGDSRAYRSESREITKDLHDFRELLEIAIDRIPDLSDKIFNYLSKSSGRLTITDGGAIEYTTGQYFPTEYRPAACRVLRDIIWASYRDEVEQNTPNPVYKDGHEIRKAIRRRGISRRVAKYYFN